MGNCTPMRQLAFLLRWIGFCDGCHSLSLSSVTGADSPLLCIMILSCVHASVAATCTQDVSSMSQESTSLPEEKRLNAYEPH